MATKSARKWLHPIRTLRARFKSRELNLKSKHPAAASTSEQQVTQPHIWHGGIVGSLQAAKLKARSCDGPV